MDDTAVLFATAAAIFGSPAFASLYAVREFGRRARANSNPSVQRTGIGWSCRERPGNQFRVSGHRAYREMAGAPELKLMAIGLLGYPG